MEATKVSAGRRTWMFVVGLVAAALIVFAATQWIDPAPYRHTDRTRSDLELIRSVLDKYRDDTGSYPSTAQGLKELLESGYVGSSTFSTDAWGSAFVYTFDEGVIRLYSKGEDKTDDNGTGDDILLNAARGAKDS